MVICFTSFQVLASGNPNNGNNYSEDGKSNILLYLFNTGIVNVLMGYNTVVLLVNIL